jgi:hypothetical protein
MKPKIRVEDGRICIYVDGKIILAMEGLGQLVSPSESRTLKIDKVNFLPGLVEISSNVGRLSICAEVKEYRYGLLKFLYRIKSSGESGNYKFSIVFDVKGNEVLRWMVPGMFYKNNTVGKSYRKYPRYDKNIDIDNLISSWWAFGSDRCSLPSVFCWVDGFTVALIAKEACCLYHMRGA